MIGVVFMSYILHRRVRNAIYVYECTSYRNNQGNPRSKQHYLGKLDADGVLISAKKKLPVQIREVKTITKRFILEPVKTSNTSRRILSPKLYTGCSDSVIESAPHAQSVPPQTHPLQKAAPSIPQPQAAPHTTQLRTADPQTPRQTSSPASSATQPHAEPQAPTPRYRPQLSATPQHETSRSPRTHTTLLRAAMLRVLRAQSRRKGR